MIEVINVKNVFGEVKKRAQISANESNKPIYVYQIGAEYFQNRFTPIPPESEDQGVLCAIIRPDNNSTNQHTQKCLAAREKERIELAEYENLWPRYCRKCGGEGGRADWDYRGECHGVPASEQVLDYCPHCVEQGICPRCGSISNNFEDDAVEQLRCYTCDWREVDHGAPEVLNPYDCGCYEDSLEKTYPQDDGGHFQCFN